MMITELQTERLIMRQFRNEDFEPLAAMMADEDQMRFIGGTSERETSWRRFATLVGHWTLRGFGFFAVEEKATGSFVGWVGPWYPEGWPEPEIGWTLVREGQGHGYATEAARRARQHVYEDLGWPTAISLIDGNNAASKKVADRLGAHFEKNITLWGETAGIYRHPGPGELN